jgi:methylated-DNA-[protein]-cysteine S-methyltransferase
MQAIGFCLFPTEIGPCALAWGPQGIVGAWLPEADEAALLARVRRRLPQTPPADPPPALQRAIERITALLKGGSDDDLSDLELDLSAQPDFHRRVFEIARTIPPGRTLSYGEVAQALGDATLARAVGQALGRNPFPIIVPCHRVLAAGGKAGGFSAPGGVKTKARLLEIEGAFKRDDALF